MARSCVAYRLFSTTILGTVSVLQTEWKKRPEREQMTWQREMKKATVYLSRVGSSRLTGEAQKIPQLGGSIL